MTSGWETVDVDGGAMRCWLAKPDGAGPFAAVAVAQHAGGVDDFIRTMTDRLAQAGFVAIAPISITVRMPRAATTRCAA